MVGDISVLKTTTHRNLAKKIIDYGKHMVTELKQQNNESLIPTQTTIINDIIRLLIGHYETKKAIPDKSIDFIGTNSEEISNTELDNDIEEIDTFNVEDDDITELRTKFNSFVKEQLKFNAMIMEKETEKETTVNDDQPQEEEKDTGNTKKDKSRVYVNQPKQTQAPKVKQSNKWTSTVKRNQQPKEQNFNQNKPNERMQGNGRKPRDSNYLHLPRYENRSRNQPHFHSPSHSAPTYLPPSNFQQPPGYYGPPSHFAGPYPAPYPYPLYR